MPLLPTGLRLIFRQISWHLNGIHNYKVRRLYHRKGCYMANLSPAEHSDRTFDYLPTHSWISSKVNMGRTWKRNGVSVTSVEDARCTCAQITKNLNSVNGFQLCPSDYEFFYYKFIFWTLDVIHSNRVIINNNDLEKKFREGLLLFN
jgi:hypothetical protein